MLRYGEDIYILTASGTQLAERVHTFVPTPSEDDQAFRSRVEVWALLERRAQAAPAAIVRYSYQANRLAHASVTMSFYEPASARAGGVAGEHLAANTES